MSGSQLLQLLRRERHPLLRAPQNPFLPPAPSLSAAETLRALGCDSDLPSRQCSELNEWQRQNAVMKTSVWGKGGADVFILDTWRAVA